MLGYIPRILQKFALCSNCDIAKLVWLDNTKATEEHQLTREPPDELVFPISLTLMTNDPVVAADGITYGLHLLKIGSKRVRKREVLFTHQYMYGT